MKKQLQCLLVVCIGISGFRTVERTIELPNDTTLSAGTRLNVTIGEHLKVIPDKLVGIKTNSCQISYTGRKGYGEERLKIDLHKLQCGTKQVPITGYIIDKNDNLMDVQIPYPGAEIMREGSSYVIILTDELNISGMKLNHVRT